MSDQLNCLRNLVAEEIANFVLGRIATPAYRVRVRTFLRLGAQHIYGTDQGLGHTTITHYGAVNEDEAAPLDNPLPVGRGDVTTARESVKTLGPDWRLAVQNITYSPYVEVD